MTPRRLLISGQVQGVGYRDWMVREARRLGLEGWVRNTPDGRVEAVLQGLEAPVATMLTLCRRGPLLARVDAIEESFWAGEVPAGFARR